MSLVDNGLPFALLLLGMGLLHKSVLHRWRGFPFPESVFIFAVGFLSERIANATISPHKATITPSESIANATKSTSMLSESIRTWRNVDPHVILFLLLPPLLFQSAFSLNLHVFRRVSKSSLVLAGPGVLLSVAFTAVVLYHYPPRDCETCDYSWWWALTAASILAATDPVAVVAVLHELGAPTAMRHLIEGESLLNDGTAFSLFLVFLNGFVNNDGIPGGRQVAMGIRQFLQLSLGGPMFGLLVASLSQKWARFAALNSTTLSLFTFTLVFATFAVAELYLHVSGVLATVAFGLYWTANKKLALSMSTLRAHNEVWEMLASVCDILIFGVSGAVASDIMRTSKGRPEAKRSGSSFDAKLFLYLLQIYVVLHLIRFVVIMLCRPFLQKHGYGFRLRDHVFLTFSGLRGAVSLALALLVVGTAKNQEKQGSLEKRARDLAFLVCGMVLLTTAINGSLASWVYRKLRFNEENTYTSPVALHGLAHVASNVKSDIAHMARDVRRAQPFLIPYKADWALVRLLVLGEEPLTETCATADTTSSTQHAPTPNARQLWSRRRESSMSATESAHVTDLNILQQHDPLLLFGVRHIADRPSGTGGVDAALRCVRERLGRLHEAAEVCIKMRQRPPLCQNPMLGISSTSNEKKTKGAADTKVNSEKIEEYDDTMDAKQQRGIHGIAPKPYDTWDDKARATYTTALQSMHNNLMEMRTNNELAQSTIAPLLEAKDCAFDIVFGDVEYRKRTQTRTAEPGSEPMSESSTETIDESPQPICAMLVELHRLLDVRTPAHRVLDVLAHKLGGGPRLLEVARQHCAFLHVQRRALAYSAFIRSALPVHSLFSAESQCPIVESVAEELDKAIHGAGAKLRSLFLGGSGSLHDTMGRDGPMGTSGASASPPQHERSVPGSPEVRGTSVLQSDKGSIILIHTLEATRMVAQRFAAQVQAAARLGFVEDAVVHAVDKLVEGIVSEVDAFDPSFSAFGRSMRASMLPSFCSRSTSRPAVAVASNALSLRRRDSERSAQAL